MPKNKIVKSERIFLASWIVIFTIMSFLWLWLTALMFANDEMLGSLILGSVDQPKEAWQDNYFFWAIIIFSVSTLTTFGWFFLASIIPDRGPGHNSSIKWPWFGLLLLNIISIIIFVLVNSFNEAEWICALIFFIIGCLGFWFSTAIATPSPFTYVLPLSRPLTQLFPFVRR